jgi:segregation and condensation protein A
MPDGLDDDWTDPRPPLDATSDEAFVLRLETYEGPIDLLLEQARLQKVDLTQISILALADQYLAFVERARRLSLELAAQYLVMAAWLAYLKSRLLLPRPPADDEPSGAELAEALAFQLRKIDAMRQMGAKLMARPRRGLDMLARGLVPETAVAAETVWAVSLYDLLSAYADHRRRTTRAQASLRIEASRLYSIEEALDILAGMLGRLPDWSSLAALLPPMAPTADPLMRRSALAATFGATLELAKAGRIAVRQDGPFSPIWIKAQTPEPHA